MTNLFQQGHYQLASGKWSNWKLECDALEVADWETLAMLIAEKASPFGSVYGVPTGGQRLAIFCQRYITSGPPLIVDDVWTTGGSIAKFRKERHLEGDDVQVWVVFARNVPTDGTRALLTMTP